MSDASVISESTFSLGVENVLLVTLRKADYSSRWQAQESNDSDDQFQSLPEDDEQLIERLYAEYYSKYLNDRQATMQSKSHFGFLQVQHLADPEGKDAATLVTLTVNFDHTLLHQLFLFYLQYGWRAIVSIRDSINLPVGHNYDWELLLGKASNLLEYLIARKLTIVEDAAYKLMLKKAEPVKNELESAISQLEIKKSAAGKWVIGNADRLPAIISALREAVAMRTELSKATESKQMAQKNQGLADIIGRVLTRHSNIQATASEQKRFADYDNDLFIMNLQEGVAAKNYEQALRQLANNCPYALLIIDGLSSTDFTTEKVESLLCNAMINCRDTVNVDIASLQKTSLISENYADWKGVREGGYLKHIADYGAEQTIADLALDKFVSDARWRALAIDDLMAELYESGVFQHDALTYIVLGRYIEALLFTRYQNEIEKAGTDKVITILGGVSAILGLALLLFVSGGTAAPVVAGGGTAVATTTSTTVVVLKATEAMLNLGRLVYAIDTVRGQLLEVDKTIATALSQGDKDIANVFHGIGILSHQRQEVVAMLPLEVIKMVVLAKLPGMYPLCKFAVHIYGFYSDLETMIDVADIVMPAKGK